MVNEEKIGVFQDAGRTDWYKELPRNVELFENLEDMKNSDSRGFLIISDKILEGDFLKNSVVYRPPSLAIGVGLHWDTPKETIREGIELCLEEFGLCLKSVFRLASIKKTQDARGLVEAGEELGIDVEYVDREELAGIAAPNPSEKVKAFEGTGSVSEAAAIKVSQGELVVEKQKFPPNLTIAIARKIQ
jgi:cobalt-precorrin 5A hydrolase